MTRDRVEPIGPLDQSEGPQAPQAEHPILNAHAPAPDAALNRTMPVDVPVAIEIAPVHHNPVPAGSAPVAPLDAPQPPGPESLVHGVSFQQHDHVGTFGEVAQVRLPNAPVGAAQDAELLSSVPSRSVAGPATAPVAEQGQAPNANTPHESAPSQHVEPIELAQTPAARAVQTGVAEVPMAVGAPSSQGHAAVPADAVGAVRGLGAGHVGSAHEGGRTIFGEPVTIAERKVFEGGEQGGSEHAAERNEGPELAPSSAYDAALSPAVDDAALQSDGDVKAVKAEANDSTVRESAEVSGDVEPTDHAVGTDPLDSVPHTDAGKFVHEQPPVGSGPIPDANAIPVNVRRAREAAERSHYVVPAAQPALNLRPVESNPPPPRMPDRPVRRREDEDVQGYVGRVRKQRRQKK